MLSLLIFIQFAAQNITIPQNPYEAVKQELGTCVKQFNLCLEHAFYHKIRVCNTPDSVNDLLRSLPFEPDSLGTHDCTFNACCSVLALTQIYNDIVHLGHCAAPANDPALKLLACIGVITAWRYSPACVDHCWQFIEEIATILNGGADNNLAQNLRTAYEGQIRREDWLRDYKQAILDKMCQFVTSAQPSLFIQRNGTSVKYYAKAAVQNNRPTLNDMVDEILAQSQLLSYVKRQTGGHVLLTRGFRGVLSDSHEDCYIHFLPAVGQQNILAQCAPPPLTLFGNFDIPDYAIGKRKQGRMLKGGNGFVGNMEVNQHLFPPNINAANRPFFVQPRVVLQVPYSAGNNPEQAYLSGVNKYIDGGSSKDEKPESHAVTATLDIAANTNTWFSAQKGMMPVLDGALRQQKQQDIETALRDIINYTRNLLQAKEAIKNL